jgi:hydroxymethylpyrimidine pyrophosphatase-like HAD family hydrolase
MAAYFIDLDGTIFAWGTNNFLPGAVEMIKAALDQGHQVIFTTQRPNIIGVDLALKREGITGLMVMSGIQNPRILVNDQGAYAHQHKKNGSYSLAEINHIKQLGEQP